MDAAARNAIGAPGTVLLDTSRPDEENPRSLLFAEPTRVLRAPTLETVPALLDDLDAAVKAGEHVAGFLSYEAGYAFEPQVFEATDPGAAPLAWFGVYEAPRVLTPPEVDHFFRKQSNQSSAATGARLQIDRAVYPDKLRAIKAHIRAGDVYQINFTDKVAFDFTGRPLAFYRALRQRQRVPYGAYLNTGNQHILCLSPELFFRRDGRRLITRPMKGTIRRGRTNVEDDALRRTLARDEKSRAENLMIVDLLRNDLSVYCQPGSVRVPALFATERYETVIQMTSTVEGRLREATRYADLFRALFPCGSVTGAPKLRAMQLIRALETGPRGVYCGAIGHIAPDERAAFNVAIRTVVLKGGRGEMGTGSGIVWDSDAHAEYEECRLKAHFLTTAEQRRADIELIETMRWQHGQVQRLAKHLERLRGSAHYFGFAFDESKLRERLAAATESLPEDGAFKVRLTMDRWGQFDLTTAPLRKAWEAPVRLAVAEAPVDTENVFLYHKTTRRAFYEAPYQRARERGFDEVLFLNERGEVTEGSRSNIFVRTGNQWHTPPVRCGLLAGTYRRHLLETLPEVSERVLRLEDVRAADALYVCNALRGWKRAQLAEEATPLEESARRAQT